MLRIKNWIQKHPFLTIILSLIGGLFAFLFFGFFLAIIVANVDSQTNASITPPLDSDKIEQRTSPSNPLSWHQIVTFSGEGIKNTETFNIPSNEWKISWDTRPGEYGDMNFQIFVYGEDESLKGVVANVIGTNKDSSIMRGSGNYYLAINAGQPYTINIEAKY